MIRMLATLTQDPKQTASRRSQRPSRGRGQYVQWTPIKAETRIASPGRACHGSTNSSVWTATYGFTTIASLPDTDIQLASSMIAFVKPTVDEGAISYIASIPEANLNSSGNTWDEAIENLQDVIAGTYRLLNRFPKSKLGPEPLRQKAFLRKHIR